MLVQLPEEKRNDALDFLGDCLVSTKAKQLRLLFRASEHRFSAYEFHRHCDGVNHTLVLVRSAAGMTFGGYTPLKWRSGDGEYEEDESGQSFLFSLDKMEHFALTDRRYGIRRYKDCGPAFGGGCDLRLGDNCGGKDDEAWSYFPTSYSGNDKYEKKAGTWKELFGANSHNRFRVSEYEVWAVEF